MRTIVAIAIGTVLIGGGARCALGGEKARAILAYERLAAAKDACPDEATMRGLVGARLGYDPFVDADGVKLRIEFDSEGRGLVGRVTLTSPEGDRKGGRTLRTASADCSELASSVSLAVALAIDPDSARAAHGEPVKEEAEPPPVPVAPAPEPTPKPAPSVSAPPKKAAPSPRSKGPHLGVRIDAGIVVGVGIVPGVSFGPRLGVGLDGVLWSLSAEGTAIVPGARATDFGTASASVVYAALVPCLHPAFANIFMADLCVAGGAGAMSSEAKNVTRSFPSTNVYGSIAPRAGLTIVPSKNVAFRLGTELGVALTRIHLNIDDNGKPREVWASPPVSFLGTLAAVFRFR